MRVENALTNVKRLYIETAPFIYYVEDHPNYADKMESIFSAISKTGVEITTSVITLTEALTKPLKVGDRVVEQAYRTLLQGAKHIELVPVTTRIAERAARLRAEHNLRTPDALHLAAALELDSDAFLTNDLTLRRVKELRVLVLDEIDLSETTL